MPQSNDNQPPVLAARPRYRQLPGGAICVAAPAKINLDLLVGPRRADGFHPLDSIVAKITLYDDITLTPRDDGQIVLTCADVDCGPAERNLAYRAARLLAENAGLSSVVGQESAAAPHGVDIALEKHIPPGKGLGGGSSDAAAVLAGLDRLWRLDTPPARLAELAATLGSDVPLFLGPPAARLTGRGEILEPAALLSFAAVLHMPDFACATADVYRAFDAFPGAAQPMSERGEIDLVAALSSQWRATLRNDLTPAAQAVSEQLSSTLARLRACTGLPVTMTGSGSAMFILADSTAEAQALAARLPTDLPGQTVIVQPNPW